MGFHAPVGCGLAEAAAKGSGSFAQSLKIVTFLGICWHWDISQELIVPAPWQLLQQFKTIFGRTLDLRILCGGV